jgi:alkylhydroperoxidase/carboxymuconolactone decarboxylase family protein YurZ
MASMSESQFDRGMRVRREVLGDGHVDRAQRRATDLDRDFQRFITEMAWGSVWTRPDLDRRTRSLITIAILAALGRTEELALHFRASRNTEMAWGGVWAGPDLDRRTRSLVTIAILAALGREELALHLRASRRTGATRREIAEVLKHVAVYAGVPAANSAFTVAKQELESAPEEGPR